MPEQQVHLTPKQLAVRLHLNIHTLHVWRKKGGGPEFIRFGATILYPLAKVEEWERAHMVTDKPNDSDLLTQQQVADRYKVTVHTVRRWRLIGGGPEYIKAGRRVLYPVAAVAEYERLRANTSDGNS